MNRTASLKRIDGDQAIQVADKATDVDTYIKYLIGLTDEQFRRVMVLPQGEVQKFLFDDSGSREQLLKQLFGGDVFEAIIEALKMERREPKQRSAALRPGCETRSSSERTLSTRLGRNSGSNRLTRVSSLTAACSANGVRRYVRMPPS